MAFESLSIFVVEGEILHGYRYVALAQIVSFVQVERGTHERETVDAIVGLDAADRQQGVEYDP